MYDKTSPDWIELKAALVWVRTRDSSEVASCMNGLLVDPRWGHIWKPAWNDLRDAVVNGKVHATGIPYDELPARPYTLRLNQIVIKRTGPLEWCSISEAVIKDLEVDEFSFSLVPTDWALTGGRGWRQVRVSRAELARAFPVRVSTVTDSRPKVAIRKQRRAFLSEAVETVIVENWPNGFPDGIDASARQILINTKLAELIKGKISSGDLEAISAGKLKKGASLAVIRKVLRRLVERS